MFGFNRAQIALHRRALALGGDRLSGGDWLALAVAWAARGAADSGLAILVRLAQRSPGGLDAVPTLATAYLVAAVDVWLGAQDPQVARERRAAAVAAGGTASLDPRSRPRFAWSDGLMALVARDASALDRAIAALERLTDVDGYWLASLRAFRRELAGDRKGAANALAELELARAQSPDQVDLDATVMGVNRLAAARWLLTEGDTLTATRLLRWTNGFARGARVARRYHPYVLYHLATIAEAQGDTSRARRDYEGFLEQYDMPPEAHRGMVEEARAALRRLSQGRD
jgi:tetratricopeptide (TPR) repeat protein